MTIFFAALNKYVVIRAPIRHELVQTEIIILNDSETEIQA